MKKVSQIKDIVLNADAKTATVKVILKNKRSKLYNFETRYDENGTAIEKANAFITNINKSAVARKEIAEDVQYN
jgi:hypothetical protein